MGPQTFEVGETKPIFDYGEINASSGGPTLPGTRGADLKRTSHKEASHCVKQRWCVKPWTKTIGK